MAYPDRILEVGALSTYGDVFEYFKGALDAMLKGKVQAEYGNEVWTNSFRTAFGGGNYPITRAQFNNIITSNFWDPNDLLTATEPVSGWPVDKVNDWAKVQSIALALFGSRTGSTSDSSFSYLTGSRSNTAGWKVYEMNLLRFALVRFEDYGSCYPEIAKRPAPTNPVVSAANRTFNWTNASGFPNVSDYEYRINASPWTVASSKPINVGLDGVVAGGVLLRTRGDGKYIEPSDSITNGSDYPAIPYTIQVAMYALISGTTAQYDVTVQADRVVSTSVTIGGFAQVLVNGNNRTFQWTVTINGGTTLGNNRGNIESGASTVGNYPRITNVAAPPDIWGTPIIIQISPNNQ